MSHQLNSEVITFKKLQAEYLPLLYSWFQEPHVSVWWPVPDKEEDFFEKFLKRIRSKDTIPYLVFINNTPFAYIQYYLVDFKKDTWLPAELPVNTIGIDQFIGIKEYIGKGYGTLFIREFIKFLNNLDQDITTIIVDPDPKNLAAIRCYEKVGFQKIGEFTRQSGQALLMKFNI